eukprot:15467912-Alexandrium_andersonii.AAC.1
MNSRIAAHIDCRSPCAFWGAPPPRSTPRSASGAIIGALRLNYQILQILRATWRRTPRSGLA